jgi:hypothetical protein
MDDEAVLESAGLGLGPPLIEVATADARLSIRRQRPSGATYACQIDVDAPSGFSHTRFTVGGGLALPNGRDWWLFGTCPTTAVTAKVEAEGARCVPTVAHGFFIVVVELVEAHALVTMSFYDTEGCRVGAHITETVFDVSAELALLERDDLD